MRVFEVPRWRGGHHPVGDAESGPIRLSFNPKLHVEFRGRDVDLRRRAAVASGSGRAPRPEYADRAPSQRPRTGRNSQFPLADLVRQSIYSRLAGYEDTNDTERLALGPTFRMIASQER